MVITQVTRRQRSAYHAFLRVRNALAVLCQIAQRAYLPNYSGERHASTHAQTAHTPTPRPKSVYRATRTVQHATVTLPPAATLATLAITG